MLPGSSQGQGPSNQGSALGMNSLQVGAAGSPMMNRMEGGGDTGSERNAGVAGNSPTGAAMQGNAAVGNVMTTPALGLVGAGNLVGSAGHILPPAQNAFGMYGPMRGGLIDPRNYGVEPDGHGCSGCTVCQGFPGQGVHGQGQFGQGQVGQGLMGQGLHGQGMPGQGCMGTAGQNAQASTGRSEEPGQGSACHGMPWMSGHCGDAPGQGQVGSGQAGGMCMGQDVSGVTPQNERLQDVLRPEADGRLRTDAVVASQAGVRRTGWSG